LIAENVNLWHFTLVGTQQNCILQDNLCSEANTNKIEKIQERALRFIYNDYNSTYESLLIVSKLPTLKVRRPRTMAIEVYKILHQESPSYLHDEWYMVNLPNLFKYLPSLFNTFNYLDAFFFTNVWNMRIKFKFKINCNP
jgi:hypothetical protein